MPKITILILFLLPVFTSCQDMLREAEAVKKNQAGLDLLVKEEYDAAIGSFKEALAVGNIKNQTRAQIYRNLAITYNTINEEDSSGAYSMLAAQCFENGTYGYLVNIADVDIIRGNIAAAREKLEKAVALKPEGLEANNSLGLIYSGEYGEEFKDPKKALPYNEIAYNANKDRFTEYVLAKNYYDLEQYVEAEKRFEELYSKYPDVSMHPYMLGVTKYKLKKKTDAEKFWAEAIKADSAYAQVIEELKEEMDNE